MKLGISDYDPATAGSGAVSEGKCHLQVAGVEEVPERDSVVVTSSVLAHEDPQMVGREVTNFFKTHGKGAQRLQLLIEATGIVDRDELVAAKAAGMEDVDVDITAMTGKTYFGTITHNKYQGRTSARIEWDFKSVDDPEASDYPRDTNYAPAVDTPEEKAAEPTEETACPF